MYNTSTCLLNGSSQPCCTKMVGLAQERPPESRPSVVVCMLKGCGVP